MNIISFAIKYRNYFYAVLLIVVLALIGKFISTVDFVQLQSYLYKMPYMLPSVIGASALGYISSTFAWQLCMGKEGKKVRFADIFMIKHVGEMLTIFNPTGIIAGDGLKATYIFRKGVARKEGLSSILLSRALLMLSGVFLIVISAVYLAVTASDRNENTAYILAAVAVLGLLSALTTHFVLHRNLYLGKLYQKIKQKTGWQFISEKSVASVYEVNQLLSDYFHHNKGKFIAAFILSAAQWLFGALEFFIVLRMLGIGVSYTDAVAVEMGVILFKTIGAVVPGQIGIEEYGNKVMLDAIGVGSNEIWLIATLMRRGRQVFWLGVAGIFMFIIQKTTHIKATK